MQNKPIEIRLKGEEPSALASMNEEFEDPIIRERNVKITCNATGGAQAAQQQNHWRDIIFNDQR